MQYNVTNENKALIVERLKELKIKYWQLADVLNVSENTVIRMMREPDDDTADAINAAIDEIETRTPFVGNFVK